MLALPAFLAGRFSDLGKASGGLSFASDGRIFVDGNCCVVPACGEAHQWAKAHFLVAGICTPGVRSPQLIGLMAFDQDRVRDVASRVAASSGLEVVEIEFHGSGKSRMLRVFIDRLPQAGVEAGEAGGVTHEDCAQFSREFGTILDVEDAVPGGPYVLEVSSPGLDRKLTRRADFERFTGSRDKLMTRNPVQGNRHFVGRLEGCREGCVVLDVSPERKKSRGASDEAKKLEIAFSNIEKANLVPEI